MRRIFRAATAALITLGLIVSGLVAGSQPAAAATTCQVSVTGLPSKIIIDASNRRYWLKAWSKGCDLDRSWSWTSANIAGPNTVRDHVDWLTVDFDADEHVTLYSSDYKAGTYTVIDDSSNIVDDDYNDLRYTWVKKTFVAKYRTYTSLTAKRSGSVVKLSGTVKRYDPSWYEYVGYKQPVTIQRRIGSSWRTVKTVWSTGGKFSYSYKTGSKYSYRAKIAENSVSMGSTSATKSAPAAPKTTWYASKISLYSRKSSGRKVCLYGNAWDAAGKVSGKKQAWERSRSRRVYLQKLGSSKKWKTVKTTTTTSSTSHNYSACSSYGKGKFRATLTTFQPTTSAYHKARGANSPTIRLR